MTRDTPNGYWQSLTTRKLWEENTRALAQDKYREIEETAAELMRRTDTSPAAIEASAARCAARRAGELEKWKWCYRCQGQGGWEAENAAERADLAGAAGHSPTAAGWVACPRCDGSGEETL